MAIPLYSAEAKANLSVRENSPDKNKPPFFFPVILERACNSEAKLLTLLLISLDNTQPHSQKGLEKRLKQLQGITDSQQGTTPSGWPISNSTIVTYYKESFSQQATGIALPGKLENDFRIHPAARENMLITALSLLKFSADHPEVSIAQLLGERTGAIRRQIFRLLSDAEVPPTLTDVAHTIGKSIDYTRQILKGMEKDGMLQYVSQERTQPVRVFKINSRLESQPTAEQIVPSQEKDRANQVQALFTIVRKSRASLTYKELHMLFTQQFPQYKELSFIGMKALMSTAVNHWIKQGLVQETGHFNPTARTRIVQSISQRSTTRDFIMLTDALESIWQTRSAGDVRKIDEIEQQVRAFLEGPTHEVSLRTLMSKARLQSKSKGAQPIATAARSEPILIEPPEPVTTSIPDASLAPITSIEPLLPPASGTTLRRGNAGNVQENTDAVDIENSFLDNPYKYPLGLNQNQLAIVFDYLRNGATLQELFNDTNFLNTLTGNEQRRHLQEQINLAYYDTVAAGENLIGFLTRCNLRLVLSVVKKRVKHAQPKDKVFQSGVKGLVNAIQAYNTTTESEFAPFAISYIQHAIDQDNQQEKEIRRIKGLQQLDKMRDQHTYSKSTETLGKDEGTPLTKLQETALVIAATIGLSAEELWNTYGTIFKQDSSIARIFFDNIRSGKSAQAVLAEIYYPYIQRLITYAERNHLREHVGTIVEGNDMLQEVFDPKNLASTLASFDPEKGMLIKWLTQSLFSKSKDVERSVIKKRTDNLTEDNSFRARRTIGVAEQSTDPVEIAIQNEQRNPVIRALRHMLTLEGKEVYAKILYFSYFMNYTTQEIAEYFHINRHNVDVRVYRAKALLKQIILEQGYGISV